MLERKPQILIVEDQRPWYEVFERSLERQGVDCDVEWAHNGQEAIERLEKQEFNVVVLDIILPTHFSECQENEGIELCKHIKAKWPNCPILAFSVRPVEIAEKQMMDAGAMGYISKPPDPKELSMMLDEIISKGMEKREQDKPI